MALVSAFILTGRLLYVLYDDWKDYREAGWKGFGRGRGIFLLKKDTIEIEYPLSYFLGIKENI